MRICIWFNLTDGPWGGGNNFLRGLRHQLLEMGHEVHHDPNRASDLVLVNAFNLGLVIELHTANWGRHLRAKNIQKHLDPSESN